LAAGQPLSSGFIKVTGARSRDGAAGAAHASMPTIYRKTAKGTAEIETRAHRLSPRVRSALILVDGRKSDQDLAALVPQAAESIAQLAAEGFIEAAAQSPPTSASMPLMPSRPAPAAPEAAAAGGAVSAPAISFETRRRRVLRAFNDAAGPPGESLAIRMEKAKTLDDLRALLPHAIRVVEAAQGREAADAFAARLQEI
jgi:hypothetical protein